MILGKYFILHMLLFIRYRTKALSNIVQKQSDVLRRKNCACESHTLFNFKEVLIFLHNVWYMI